MTNFNGKTIAVTLLVFISVIVPTLTVVAVCGKVTDNKIGTVETILATCWVGLHIRSHRRNATGEYNNQTRREGTSME